MIDMKLKMQFFDPSKLLREADRAKARVLSKAGSYVWKTDKQSIKKRKGPSRPGQPPHSHGGGLFKRHIYFSRPANGADSVVIGPALLSNPHPGGDGKPVAGGTIPEVLEFGGSITRIEYFSLSKKKWVLVSRRFPNRGKGRPRRKITKNIKARPSARPALAKEAPNFPQLFKNTIGGG